LIWTDALPVYSGISNPAWKGEKQEEAEDEKDEEEDKEES
jgi:hypothetical protein